MKLAAELPGILNWALDGLRQWHQQGLNPPKIIQNATREYERESDLVGQWLDECTVRDTKMEMKAGDGYQSFKRWCEDQGIKAMGQPISSRRIKEHGIEAGPRTMKGVFYTGIGLVTLGNEPR